MANQFLADDFTNRHDHLRIMMASQEVDNIPGIILGLENVKERVLDEKWAQTKRTIIACVAFKRKCGGRVGVWLAEKGHPQRTKITEMCKWAAAVYKDWDTIVHLLSDREMASVNIKSYSLRNLYDVRGEAWRKREKKRNVRPRRPRSDPTPEQQYDETTYQLIKQQVINSRILNGVSFDHEQVDIMMGRLTEDLKEVCDVHIQ